MWIVHRHGTQNHASAQRDRREQEVLGHRAHLARRLCDRPRPAEGRPRDGQQLRLPREEQLLRRAHLPPGRAGIRGPGRRPARRRDRRTRLQAARRVEPVEVAARHGGHGVERRRSQRLAVLHHARRRSVPRLERRVQPLRPGHLWDGGRGPDPGRRHDAIARRHRLVRRLVLAGFLLTAFAAAACGYSDPYAGAPPVANESPGPSSAASVSPGADDFNTCNTAKGVTYPDGLQIADLKVGTGDTAIKGENTEVQYSGWLTDGHLFDSSRQAGRGSFTIQIGVGQVITGWDEGVPGMKVGGKRCLKIPGALAYGAQGQTDQTTGATIIPPNATLVFEIELLSVKPGPSPTPSPSASPSK